jgi:hypothetical protein
MTVLDEEIREIAKARVSFRMHALAYVLVNALLVVIWWTNADGAPTLRDDRASYFWPLWPMLGWGIGLAFHGYGAYGTSPGSLAREEEKLRAKYGPRGP